MIIPIKTHEFISERMPTPSCHASTLVQTSDGTLLCAWFGGQHEGASDVGIYLSRRASQDWTQPVEVAVGSDSRHQPVPCWNPVLFEPSPGHLWLFYKAGRQIARWKGFLKESADDGKTWSVAKALPNGILGPIKNKPIRLKTGRILAGSSEELGGWRIHMEYTDDEGATWHRTRSLNAPGIVSAIQPSLLEQSNGEVVAIGRTQQGHIFYTVSKDHGNRWSPLELLGLSNPNSGIDAVALKNGTNVLVYNDSTSHRTPLNLAVSGNGGKWTPVATLESEAGEFSYPAVMQTADGMIHISYTWNRVKIKHLVIDPSTIETPSSAK